MRVKTIEGYVIDASGQAGADHGGDLAEIVPQGVSPVTGVRALSQRVCQLLVGSQSGSQIVGNQSRKIVVLRGRGGHLLDDVAPLGVSSEAKLIEITDCPGNRIAGLQG